MIEPSTDVICPDCRVRLSFNDSAARCSACRREFRPLYDDVLSLLPGGRRVRSPKS